MKFARRVKVVVPASTANLGPGFDCLGLALALYNTVELAVIPLGEGLDVDVHGEGQEVLPRDGSNLIMIAVNQIADAMGYGPVALYVRATNGIPLNSGLGSSAAATVGGLVAANALFEAQISREALLHRAYKIEGHPDNAAPAIFGGLTVTGAEGETVRLLELPLPPMQVVVVLPEVQLSTAAARAALPARVPLQDAVFNIGQAIFVAQALQQGDYDMLRWAMRDRLHQPYRKGLIPGYDAAVSAAREQGAAAVVLSGAGPSLAAFAPDHHQAIAAAMQAAFAGAGVAARAFVLPVDQQGVQVSVLR